MIHLDTSFAVDWIRERARGARGPAHAWIRQSGRQVLGISVFSLRELYAGAAAANHPAREREAIGALEADVVAYPDERLAPLFGSMCAKLGRAGHRLPAMDALIAASALLEGAALLTRNARHFARIPGLDVLSY